MLKNVEKGDVDSTQYKFIGSLRYLFNTKLVPSYSVRIVNRVMEMPKTSHLAITNKILDVNYSDT